MAFDPPGEILLDCEALTLLARVLEAVAPEEGCALLLGEAQAGGAGCPPLWRVRRLWPTLNTWEPAAERCQRFRIDPREHLLAQKWARESGWSVLGSVHSHPGSAPIPSAIDRALAELPTLMLIRGLEGDAAALRCWWLDPPAEPRPLPWKMVD
jgi:proteasome lid subunit RPN8/RPN11